jgi:transcriptional regulator with XRE-family HTH domain
MQHLSGYPITGHALRFATMPGNLHKRLKIARERAGLSQAKLAQMVGKSQPAVYKWEADKSQPDSQHLALIAHITGVSLLWLIMGELPLSVRDADSTIANLKPGGRAVPMVSILDAAEGNRISDAALRVYSVFPCGPKSSAITLEDDANAPQFPPGTVWIVDPDAPRTPRKMVLATVNGAPVLGRLTMANTDDGIVTIVTPLGEGWPAYRSDEFDLSVHAVMVASIQPG